ncbi:hypothetical protein SLA2020_026010 [Shorea laevis]
MFVESIGSPDPYWSDMISFSLMVVDDFRTTRVILDVYGNETSVKKFLFPSNIFMEVINCVWVQQLEKCTMHYHFEFKPITCNRYTSQEDKNDVHNKQFVHFVVLWNAKGSLRAHFWEVVNFLHYQTLLDVMIIFNTTISKD